MDKLSDCRPNKNWKKQNPLILPQVEVSKHHNATDISAVALVYQNRNYYSKKQTKKQTSKKTILQDNGGSVFLWKTDDYHTTHAHTEATHTQTYTFKGHGSIEVSP